MSCASPTVRKWNLIGWPTFRRVFCWRLVFTLPRTANFEELSFLLFTVVDISSPIKKKKRVDDKNCSDSTRQKMTICDQLECLICLEEFRHGDERCWSRNPKCGHSFHHECMKEWLLRHDACPCCRNNYLEFDGDKKSYNYASPIESGTIQAQPFRHYQEYRSFTSEELPPWVIFFGAM